MAARHPRHPHRRPQVRMPLQTRSPRTRSLRSRRKGCRRRRFVKCRIRSEDLHSKAWARVRLDCPGLAVRSQHWLCECNHPQESLRRLPRPRCSGGSNRKRWICRNRRPQRAAVQRWARVGRSRSRLIRISLPTLGTVCRKPAAARSCFRVRAPTLEPRRSQAVSCRRKAK